MRVLIISDSHGDSYSIKSAVEQQPTAKLMYYLGDGEHDFDDIPSIEKEIPIIKVKGNCDFGSQLPSHIVDEAGGVRFYCTHGYEENVKISLNCLRARASENKALIALYGHTHTPDTTYDNGIWLVNPGSIRQDRYAVVDITPGGVIPILMKLR